MADGKETLMQAAEVLFAARGYSATSVRDICKKAKVTQPSLYHFFGSKEKLLIELIDSRYGDYSAAMMLALQTATTAFEVCRDYARFVFARMRQQPTTAKFVFSIMFGPQQDIPRAAVTAHLAKSRYLLTDHLRRVSHGVPEQRLIFASVIMHGMVTPAILQFLSFGTDNFAKNMPECLAERAAAILTDNLPVCNWPEG